MFKKLLLGGVSAALLSSAFLLNVELDKKDNVVLAASLSELKEDLEKNESEKNTLDWQINELNNQINQLNSQASVIETEAKAIDDLVVRVLGEINVLENQIKEIEKNIGDIKYEKSILERNLNDAKKTFEEQTTHLTGENNDYLDYALKSENPLTMKLRLEQLDMAYKVYQSAVSHYEEEIKDRNSKEGTLNLERSNVENQKKVLQVKKDFVDEKLNEKVALLNNLEKDIQHTYEIYDDVESSAVLIDQMISGLQQDISAEEKRQADEAARLLALKEASNKTSSQVGDVDLSDFNGTLMWPSTASSRVSSAFGYRSDPFTGVKTFHGGIDIPAKSGTGIVSSGAGVVLTSGWIDGYGYVVIIKHSETLTTLYAHNSKNLVVSGQKVSRGEKIALVGSTGRSTGPHIHYEVRVNGSRVNPMSYLK